MTVDVQVEPCEPRSLLAEAATGAHLWFSEAAAAAPASAAPRLRQRRARRARPARWWWCVRRRSTGRRPSWSGSTVRARPSPDFAFELASEQQAPVEIVTRRVRPGCSRHPIRSGRPGRGDHPDWQLLMAESVAGYAEKFPDVTFSSTVVQARPPEPWLRLPARVDRRGRRARAWHSPAGAARLGEPVRRGARALHGRSGARRDNVNASVQLGASECRDLLSDGVVGRVAMATPVGPRIVPVNYSLHGDAIVFPHSAVQRAEHVRLGHRPGVRGRPPRLCGAPGLERGGDRSSARRRRSRRGAAHPAGVGATAWAPGSRNLYVMLPWRELTGASVSATTGQVSR